MVFGAGVHTGFWEGLLDGVLVNKGGYYNGGLVAKTVIFIRLKMVITF